MPELPEVETVRSDLDPVLRGRRAIAVTVTHPRSVRRQSHLEFVSGVQGRTIDAVRRHGKFLIFDLGDDALVAHLRMSGQLRVASPDDKLAKHTHVVIDLDDGRQLRFVDPRTFGEMFVDALDDDRRPHALRSLGPDALDAQLTALALHDRLTRGRRTSSLKAALLDQNAVAGVGNLYADEALFASRLAPTRPAPTLEVHEAAALRTAVRRIMRAAIAARGSSFSDEGYVDAYGLPGRFARKHKVYARTGEPCPRCGTPIEKAVVAQRGTHFCPTCQVA